MVKKYEDYKEGKIKWVDIVKKGEAIDKKDLVDNLIDYVSNSEDKQMKQILYPLFYELTNFYLEKLIKENPITPYTSVGSLLEKAMCLGFLLYKLIDENQLTLLPEEANMDQEKVEEMTKLTNLIKKIGEQPTIDGAVEMIQKLVSSGQLKEEDMKKIGLTDEQIKAVIKQSGGQKEKKPN